MSRAVPQPLAKRGLQTMADNMPPNMDLGNWAKDFAAIFRTELINRFVVAAPSPAKKGRR